MVSIVFLLSTGFSLLFAFLAIMSGNGRYLIASACLYFPLAWYLNATPRFEGALLLYLFHLLIAYSLYRGPKLLWLAWVSFVALLAVPAWLVISVLFH
ncbi:hypothetical protein KDJ56_07425 [Brevibacillus composti]|uniref:Uncharacterized protein n=1 Tax=Brevibacillus composti TaxID=2796470 RepID=A0A7T5ENC3_9BACL|nr:hypothetical protein [Brevibacillus composti]QQE75758.1 hypothetical protein JD108_07745 [Brevibacillus composti]QUO42784.1 hypothetical protein KDJ56_07425 [Brevibacillus composti]